MYIAEIKKKTFARLQNNEHTSVLKRLKSIIKIWEKETKIMHLDIFRSEIFPEG